MKIKLQLLAASILLSGIGIAQPSIQSPLAPHEILAPTFPVNKAIGETCGEYANHYLMNKVTGLAYYPIGNDATFSWYEGYGQYFDCPQEMTIQGVGFSGFARGVPSVDAIVQIYSVNADSSGNVLLASDTVSVTSGSYTTSGLITQYYEADFDVPVTINDAYLVFIKNPTSDTLNLYASNLSANDGQGEFLMMQHYNNPGAPSFIGWYHTPYGSSYWDFDFIMSPIISFPSSSAPDFLTNDTLCVGEQFCIDYNQTAAFRNHMYSQRSSTDSLDQIKIVWGDGLELNNLSLGCHVYNDTGSMTVSVQDTIFTYGIPGGNQYCPVSFDTSMFVLSEPIVDFTSDFDGSSLSINFMDNSDYTGTWSWDFGDGNLSTDENPSHTFAANGTYNVKLTVTNDCGSVTDSLLLDLSSVGIEKLAKESFTFYPNPAKNVFNLETQGSSIQHISIINAIGQTVWQKSLFGNATHTVNINQWAKGIYFIKLNNENGQRTEKLIVQ